MLTRGEKWLLAYLAGGYLVFAELLSLVTSKFGPPCLLISQYQPANNQPGYYACAPVHEGIMRGLDLVSTYITHDNILAAATVVIAVFTWTLWKVSKQQARDSRAVQRAHVFPMQPQHQFLMDQNGVIFGLRLWIPWRNSGPTPTGPVNSMVAATWVPDPNDFEFGVVAQQGLQQPFVLGPTAEIASGTVDIGPPHLNDILIHRNGAQFFWGWARYQDAFQPTSRHVIEFCFRVIVEGQLGPPPFTGRVLFAFDGPHNRYYTEHR